MRLRSLIRRPALAVIGTLAASVGALVATFGVVHAALLRPPPFRDPGRLTMLHTTHTRPDGTRYDSRWSYPRAQLLRREATSFAHVAHYTGTELSLTGGDEAEAVRGEFAGSGYFAVLGVSPALGRDFGAGEDDVATRTPVVVLSHELWQRRFGGRGDVVGATIGVNGVAHDVVGVMPIGFRGLTDRAQLWLPAVMAPALTYPEYLTTDQDFISVVARLAPGATVERGTTELRTIVPRIYAALPSTDHEPGDRPGGIARSLNEARVHPEVRAALLALLGAVALLHLLALANVTSLLLGRALERGREFAVRTALGCSPRALWTTAFAEAALVVAMGGVAGTVLGASLGTLVAAPLELWGPRNFYGALASFAEPGFSWAVVSFGLGVTVATAALAALAPALAALHADWLGGLRDAPRGSSARGTSLRRPSPRAFLVASEMALAMTLCVVGGLMFASFARIRGTPIGVETDGVLTFSIRPPDRRVPPEEAPAYIDRMLEAITAVPGVLGASVDGGAPVSGTARSTLHVVGRPAPSAGQAPPVLRHYVAPAHFATLGIPVVRGRSFTAHDVAGSPKVAIISETAARTFWPGADPIGERVWFGGGSGVNHPDSSAQIVGVVRDVMYEPLDSDPNRSSFYTPYAQFTYAWRVYFVRVREGIDPLALAAPLRRAVHAVDPGVPVVELRDLRSLIGASWSRQRNDAFFYGSFAILALGLALSGIYAVVSHAVGERSREMGIRLALGSQAGGVVRLVVREGLTFPTIGVLAGVALALAAGRVLRASLHGVAPTDPIVLGGTMLLLWSAALVACLVPARRATRVDPCETLRTD